MSSDQSLSSSSRTAKPKTKKTKDIAEKDRDVITNEAGKRTINRKCANVSCHVRATEKPLKACARCKTMVYCSRECQAAHWPTHKQSCQNNVDHIAELAKADEEGTVPEGLLPPGMSLVELDQQLEKWVKYHNSLLMAATIHALSLPRDIKRSRQFLLRVKVSYRPDNGGLAGKLFRVDDASLIGMDSARKLGGVWPLSIDQVAQMREESEAVRRGTVAAVALECEPLAMQIVPFGSLRDLSPLRIQQQWKEILIRNVDAGKRFTRFE